VDAAVLRGHEYGGGLALAVARAGSSNMKAGPM
jgi:hypothetical protein